MSGNGRGRGRGRSRGGNNVKNTQKNVSLLSIKGRGSTIAKDKLGSGSFTYYFLLTLPISLILVD